MGNPQGMVSRDELIAYARRADVVITPHQLVRWHREGLLPRPDTRSNGKGKGTTSYYLASAQPQAVFLSQSMRLKRDFDDAAVKMWLAGFAVTPRFRTAFVRILDREIDAEQNTIALNEAGDENNAIDRAAHDRPSPDFARVNTNNRPTLQLLISQIQLGVFSLDDYDVATLGEIFTQLGQPQQGVLVTSVSADKVKRFATNEEREKAPRLRAELQSGIAAFSTVSLRNTVSRLSDVQLEADRTRAQSVWLLISRSTRLTLPLPSGLFRAEVLAWRASALARLLMRDVQRGIRQQGFSSIQEAFDAFRATGRLS